MTDEEAKAKWMAVERPLCVECAGGGWCLFHREGFTVLARIPAIFTKCGNIIVAPASKEKRFPTCKICCKLLNNEKVTGGDYLRRAIGII